MRTADPVADAEDALVAQWSLFGTVPGAALHDDPAGVRWYETAIRCLPYNGAIRTRLDGGDADTAIDRVLAAWAGRGAQGLWFVLPTSTPADLAGRLAARGLQEGAPITCMWRDLASERPGPAAPPGVTIAEVDDPAALERYTDLTCRYWSVPDDDRPHVAALQRALGPGAVPGRRLLALDEAGDAIGKAFLSLAGPPGVAAIFGMNVLPQARGRGIAGALTAALLSGAADAGCARVVLHSTPGAVRLYERFGFAACAPLAFLTTGAMTPPGH